MQEILITTFLRLFFRTFSTTLVRIISILIKKRTNKFLSFILSFASGLMMSIICFDLIPEAMNISDITGVIFSIILGIITMIACDIIVEKKFSQNFNENNRIKNNKKSNLLKTGIVISIGLAIHNFPEGLAIRLWI